MIFEPDEDVSERIIFPVAESPSREIEDARFVEFSDGGQKTYYATYTAYSGAAIRSELIETSDFMSFRMTPLQGAAARNKGMALFPRKDQRQVCDDRAAGQREPLFDLFQRSLPMERRPGHSETRISMGVRADRQLRIADRTR